MKHAYILVCLLPLFCFGEQHPFRILGFEIGEPIDAEALLIENGHSNRLCAQPRLITNQWVNLTINPPIGVFDRLRLHYKKCNGTNRLDRVVLAHRYQAHVRGEDILEQLNVVVRSVREQFELGDGSWLSDYHVRDSAVWLCYKDGLSIYAEAEELNDGWSLALYFDYDQYAVKHNVLPFDASRLMKASDDIRNSFLSVCDSNRVETARALSSYKKALQEQKCDLSKMSTEERERIKEREFQFLKLKKIQEELKAKRAAED